HTHKGGGKAESPIFLCCFCHCFGRTPNRCSFKIYILPRKCGQRDFVFVCVCVWMECGWMARGLGGGFEYVCVWVHVCVRLSVCVCVCCWDAEPEAFMRCVVHP